MDVLLDPLFVAPFVNGLLLAVLLALLGPYARLRGEWLASLGVAQAAAAGLLLGAVVEGPAMVGAFLAAALAAVAKALLGRQSGNDAYAVMLLVGWSAALLLAANADGEDLSRALLEGQLYFTGTSEMLNIAALLGIVAVTLWVLSRRLLLARLFPDRIVDDRRPAARHDLVFDVLVAVSLALAAAVVGVMAAFALVFIPAWVAFRFAGNWQAAMAWSLGLGALAYVGSFAIAILFDQPYGPVLVAALLVVGSGRALATGW
jgi:zinc transport system permease protein